MVYFPLYLFASLIRSFLHYTQGTIKLSKSCQAFRLWEKEYYNLYQTQTTDIISLVNIYRTNNYIGEYYNSNSLWFFI